jgi:hypothetical protein
MGDGFDDAIFASILPPVVFSSSVSDYSFYFYSLSGYEMVLRPLMKLLHHLRVIDEKRRIYEITADRGKLKYSEKRLS